MPLPDAPDYSKRIYELLKETDLENLTYSQFQGVAEKLFIEPENEDEMRRLVLIQMARMAVRGSWDGFLTGGGGSGGAPTDAEYVVMSLNGTLTNERVLTAGTGISITDGGAGGNVTIASTVTGGIGGSIATTQVAVGSGTDTVSGSAALTLNGSVLKVENQIELSSTGASGILKNSESNQDLKLQVSGTGNVRIENQTTNTASQLNVKGNGTGTPKINLSNDSKAVSLECDTNQKLTVKGGTEEFVLDVSSASGGITFPDGTTQNTAASGGAVTFQQSVLPATIINSGSNDLFLVSKMGLWGNRGSSAGTYNGSAIPHFFPFTNPVGGDIDHISINISSDGTGVYGFAIYSDSNGVPNAKIGGDMAYTGGSGGTGREDLTPASTVTLEQGKQYWIGVVETSTGNTSLTAESGNDICSAHPISSSTSNLSAIATLASLTLSSSSNTLPASVTAANLDGDFQPQIRWGIVYA